jgi:hypothetical protein
MRNGLFMILFLFNHAARSQERKGFEQYYYPGNSGILPSLSSRLFYQDSKGWYTEFRYNYEQDKTVACSAGKSFSTKGTLSYSVTPLVGVLGGKLQGVTLGLNTSFDYKGIFFTSFIQRTTGFEKEKDAFLFSWSELSYHVTNHFSAGLAVEQTHFYSTPDNWEPGIEMDISIGNWSFPSYIFKPAANRCYFVAGVSREW